MEGLSIAARCGEPLAAWFSAESRSGDLVEQRFECGSHGDRVSGRCWRPAGSAAPRTVLALHELSSSKDADVIASAARIWARAGYATAAIDLPLHGERHNAKLASRALAAAESSASPDRGLWRAVVLQGVRDLARTLDALETRGPLPALACVAFGGSAAVAFAHARLDSRVTMAVGLGAPRPLALDGLEGSANPLVWIARPDDLVKVWCDGRV